MLSSEITTLIIILIMLAVNSVFAAYEIALTSVNMGKLKLLTEQKKRGAAAALSMKNRMEASLAVVQIGITLAGAIAAATGGAGAEEKLSPYIQNLLNVSESFADFTALTVIVLPLTAVTIIFGELVPKTIAIKNSEKVCLFFSPVLKYFSYIVYPTVIFFEWMTKTIVRLFETKSGILLSGGTIGLAELRAQASALKANRVISLDQEKMIIGVSSLLKTTVSDIMVPEYDIVTLFAEAILAEQLLKIQFDPYTRFPVTEKESDPQYIIGYVNIKELIFLAKSYPANPNVREIVRPLLTFSSGVTIGDAFAAMMKDHVHLALVKDNNNQITGMITIEDILEEVVGDMQDEFDRLPKHITPSGKNFIVGGGAALDALFRSLNIEYEREYPEDMTFSEWVKKNHDDKLRGGDVIKINSISVLVRKVKLNHVFEALVSPESVSGR